MNTAIMVSSIIPLLNSNRVMGVNYDPMGVLFIILYVIFLCWFLFYCIYY